MGVINQLKWAWDSRGIVKSLLYKWRPRNCKNEKDHENSLSAFLRKKLPEIQITPQYARGRFRADLKIGKDIVIEIKHNLDSTAKYERLLGQVVINSEWEGVIILLLVGNTNPNLKKQLISDLKRLGLYNSWSASDDKVLVIEK